MTIASRLLPTAPVAALLLMASAAQADTRASAIAGVDAGYGSNPYFGGQDQSSGSVTFSLAPKVNVSGPTSNVMFSGKVDRTFFTKYFDDTTNWSVGAAADLKLSPLSSLSLSAGYSSTVNNGLNTSVTQPLPPGELPDPLPDPLITDAGGLRTKTLTGEAGFSTTLSPRDTLSFGGNVRDVDFPATYGSSYREYGGNVSFMHSFSERFSGGVHVSYSKSDYDQALFGTSEQISPGANITLNLAPRTVLQVSAGASFSKQTGPLATGGTRAYFSGSFSLCHSGDRSNACVTASRSVGATAQAGSSTITSIGASYDYKLTPRSSFQLGAQYSDTQGIGSATAVDTGYAVASAGYQRQINDRLSFTVNARYTDPFKSVISRGKSFYGGVGLTYRLGQ